MPPVRPLQSPAAATRGPVSLDLDWDALEIAVERNSPDTDSYLDLTTGRVLTITTGDPEAAINRQTVSENIRNFLRVEPASSREQYRWMERCVGSVVDERWRALSSRSMQGRVPPLQGLGPYPAERERWFCTARTSPMAHHHWLEQHDIRHDSRRGQVEGRRSCDGRSPRRSRHRGRASAPPPGARSDETIPRQLPNGDAFSSSKQRSAEQLARSAHEHDQTRPRADTSPCRAR